MVLLALALGWAQPVRLGFHVFISSDSRAGIWLASRRGKRPRGWHPVHLCHMAGIQERKETGAVTSASPPRAAWSSVQPQYDCPDFDSACPWYSQSPMMPCCSGHISLLPPVCPSFTGAKQSSLVETCSHPGPRGSLWLFS